MSVPAYWSEKRTAVANAYPGKKWAEKVSKMPEEQAHRIWESLQKQNKKKGEETK